MSKVIEAREECKRRGLDPDDDAADGVLVWMVVDKELQEKARPNSRGPDCACCERQPRKDCTVPGCTMKNAAWAL